MEKVTVLCRYSVRAKSGVAAMENQFRHSWNVRCTDPTNLTLTFVQGFSRGNEWFSASAWAVLCKYYVRGKKQPGRGRKVVSGFTECRLFLKDTVRASEQSRTVDPGIADDFSAHLSQLPTTTYASAEMSALRSQTVHCKNAQMRKSPQMPAFGGCKAMKNHGVASKKAFVQNSFLVNKWSVTDL
jgi:hypothetical protein